MRMEQSKRTKLTFDSFYTSLFGLPLDQKARADTLELINSMTRPTEDLIKKVVFLTGQLRTPQALTGFYISQRRANGVVILSNGNQFDEMNEMEPAIEWKADESWPELN